MRHYWKYLRPYLPAMIIGPLLMIVEVIGEVTMPMLLSRIIDHGINGPGGIPYIIMIGAAMIGTALIMLVTGVGGAYFAVKVSSGSGNDLRKDMFSKIQKFSFANIDHFSTGSLITRLTNDITQLQNMLQMLLRMALRAPGMLIGALIMALTLNAKLALIILAAIPLLSIAIYLVIRIGLPRFTLVQEKLDSLNTATQENLTNIRVVKSFIREGYEEEKYK